MYKAETTRQADELYVLGCGGELTEEESIEDIVRMAYRELEVSKRRGQMIVANARMEASQICQQARQEAERIIEHARVQAEVEAQARRAEIAEEARRKGLEEGHSMAAAESRGALAAARQLRQSLEEAYRSHLREAEREILDTVLAIAERVVNIEQEEFREVLGAVVHQVLDEQSAAHDVSLVLNPADYDSVIAYLCERDEICDRVAGIAATASVPSGSCKFRGPDLNLDLALSRRFDQVSEHLRRQWELSHSPASKE